jgi:predicted adenylyl cyclase CyaB
MATHIEIKARVRDVPGFMARARALAGVDPVELSHQDIFFPAQHGRLKLRVYAPDQGELIYYDRANVDGPKTSIYQISRTAEPELLQIVLAAAHGVRGVVRKRRLVYKVGQTRVHLDAVEGLGDFMELEVVMRPGQPLDEGVQVAQKLMAKLAIDPADLIDCAYIDLLEHAVEL